MTGSIAPHLHLRLKSSFDSVDDAAIDPGRPGPRDRFATNEEEEFLDREVQRMLWEPKLPNAGDRERKWPKQMRPMARNESLVEALRAAVGLYAWALERCLPAKDWIRKADGATQTLPGCYYSRRPVTMQTNKNLFLAAAGLRAEAQETKNRLKEWFAQFILGGCPQPVSNFRLECLYLLRGSDGSVTRLVRLTNTKGEMSCGREIGEADMLPNDMYAGSEKFRQWAASRGNFTWGCEGGAGNAELQLLQLDVTEEAAYRVIKLVEYVGWYEIKAKVKSEKESGKVETADAEERAPFQNGLWVFEECVVTPDGKFILPDHDGIFWCDGEGYAISRKGRELDYTHGKPKMRPPKPDGGGLMIGQVKFDMEDWGPLAKTIYAGTPEGGIPNPIGGFFREVCTRFHETAGSYEGWFSVGAMLGCLAAPELFVKHGNFPILWVSGGFGSGKTTYTAWLMSFCGFNLIAGLGLISSSVTAVGIACQLENYSNLPLWLDEYRENMIDKSKTPFLRDPYNRALANKWTEDGIQRLIRTMPIVSGESTSSDGATRSRYPHVQVSEQKRTRNHFDWMQAHHEYFFLIFRELLRRRKEFVELTLQQVDRWLAHKDLAGVEQRVRMSHAVCYAAFAAASMMLQSHTAGEVSDGREFLVKHALRAAADVRTEKNINVFIQDLLVAYNCGAISSEVFRVEKERVAHAPGRPNQLVWDKWRLYVEPEAAIAELNIFMRSQGKTVTLRLKDLRDQLSQDPYWIRGKGTGLKRRFGKKGSKTMKAAWGFDLDLHPLGYQMVSDEEWEAAKIPADQVTADDAGVIFEDGDPRKGPMYGIVEGVEKYAAKS